MQNPRVNHIFSATTDIKVSSHQSSVLCFPESQIHTSVDFKDAFPISEKPPPIPSTTHLHPNAGFQSRKAEFPALESKPQQDTSLLNTRFSNKQDGFKEQRKPIPHQWIASCAIWSPTCLQSTSLLSATRTIREGAVCGFPAINLRPEDNAT